MVCARVCVWQWMKRREARFIITFCDCQPLKERFSCSPVKIACPSNADAMRCVRKIRIGTSYTRDSFYCNFSVQEHIIWINNNRRRAFDERKDTFTSLRILNVSEQVKHLHDSFLILQQKGVKKSKNTRAHMSVPFKIKCAASEREMNQELWLNEEFIGSTLYIPICVALMWV